MLLRKRIAIGYFAFACVQIKSAVRTHTLAIGEHKQNDFVVIFSRFYSLLFLSCKDMPVRTFAESDAPSLFLHFTDVLLELALIGEGYQLGLKDSAHRIQEVRTNEGLAGIPLEIKGLSRKDIN